MAAGMRSSAGGADSGIFGDTVNFLIRGIRLAVDECRGWSSIKAATSSCMHIGWHRAMAIRTPNVSEVKYAQFLSPQRIENLRSA